MFFRVSVLALVFLLVACGGSGGGESTEEPEALDVSLHSEAEGNNENIQADQQVELNTQVSVENAVEPITSPPQKQFIPLSEFAAESSEHPVEYDDAALDVLKNAHYEFAFGKLNHEPGRHNLHYAAFDMQYLLAHLGLGAGGTTLDAFNQASRLDVGQDSTHAIFKKWEQQLNTVESISRSRLFWGHSGYVFSRDYLQKQYDYYLPEFFEQDFIASSRGRYSSLVDVIGSEAANSASVGYKTRMVLVQKNDIDTYWADHLEVTPFEGRFQSLEEEAPVWLDMVHLKGIMKSYQSEEFKAVEVPFRDSELALLVVIPEPDRFSAIANELDLSFYQMILDNLVEQEELIALPLLRNIYFHRPEDLGPAFTDPVYYHAHQSKSRRNATKVEFGGWTVNAPAEETSPILEEGEVANFSLTNGVGHLYLKSLWHDIHFEITEAGVESSDMHVAAFQESDQELRSLSTSDAGVFAPIGYTYEIQSSHTGHMCFAEPDQRAFIYVLYAKSENLIVSLGYGVSLSGEQVEVDWISYLAPCSEGPPPEVSRD